MEATARLKNLRISPRKLRLLADAVRGQGVERAISTLRFSSKKMSQEMIRAIRSAISNATNERSADVDKMIVKEIFIDGGPTMKRFMSRARGSSSSILKRTSHLTVLVGEKDQKTKPAKKTVVAKKAEEEKTVKTSSKVEKK